MDAERVAELLGATPPFAGQLHVVDEVDSTNDELRRLAAAGGREGTVVVAERQSAGRGRLGRHWHSPPGLGLYLSVLLRPREPAALVTRWTLVASIAAAEACRRVGGCAVCIEWPNDLVFDDRKLAGILAELRHPADLIIGAGINVNHARGDFPPELRAEATSLHLASGRSMLDRELLAVRYLQGIAQLARPLSEGAWNEIAARWEALAPGARGVPVRVRGGACGGTEDEFEGYTAGLDGSGALLVRRRDGRVQAVRMADAIEWLAG